MNYYELRNCTIKLLIVSFRYDVTVMIRGYQY